MCLQGQRGQRVQSEEGSLLKAGPEGVKRENMKEVEKKMLLSDR